MSPDFFLTKRGKLNLQGRKRNLTCDVCKQPLEPGDTIHKSNGSNYYYHVECFEKLRH